MLKFKLDENLPSDSVQILIAAGYDALTVFDQQLNGKVDEIVALACQSENRTLITLDLDFSDIRRYPPQDYSGIIILRLARLDKQQVHNSLLRLVGLLSQEDLVGKLWIVDEVSVRIRS